MDPDPYPDPNPDPYPDSYWSPASTSGFGFGSVKNEYGSETLDTSRGDFPDPASDPQVFGPPRSLFVINYTDPDPSKQCCGSVTFW